MALADWQLLQKRSGQVLASLLFAVNRFLRMIYINLCEGGLKALEQLDKLAVGNVPGCLLFKKQATSRIRSGLILWDKPLACRNARFRAGGMPAPRVVYLTAPSTERLALSSLSKVVTKASVVSSKDAMLAALLRAVRTTLTGSMMPALYISTYSPLLAS